jgi:hypothetical protein
VKLIPTQFVKPFVKSNKNDFPRCRSHRRSGRPAEYALRSDQDRRSA